MKFGRWTVLQYKAGDKTALCRCDCGKQTEVRYTCLVNNRSSGCSKQCGLANLAGLVFGSLSVKPEYKAGAKGRLSYLCNCECGRSVYVSAQKLMYGKITDCGCIEAQDGKFLANRVLAGYKRNAKIREIEFNLTLEQFLQLAANPCSYCKSPPSNRIENKWNPVEFIYSGIDRIDNNKGYTAENCVSCCKICNIAKNDLSYQEFRDWIKKLVEVWK